MKKLFSFLSFSFLTTISLAQTATQTFTSSGVFTVPVGVTEITIEVVGAGGDGGSNGGGGGGAGGYSMGTFSVVPLSTLSVIVGTNGSGSAAGTSSVTTLISATGGNNGTSGGTSPGGSGGIGSGGITNNTGGAGGNGTWTYFGGGGGGAAGPSGNGNVGGNTIPWTGICITPGGSAGTSGGAPGGNGGKGSGFTDASCIIDNPATPGLNYGGGGGGGNGNSGPASLGSDGVVIISHCNLDLSTTVTGPTITANAVSPISYQWIDCSTMSPILGETNDSYTATLDGSYAVIIEDGDCIDTSACVNILTESLNDFKDKKNISVQPNPFTNKINIQNVNGDESVELINSLGKVVWAGENIEQKDFSNLPKDAYVLKIIGIKGIQTITVIKE